MKLSNDVDMAHLAAQHHLQLSLAPESITYTHYFLTTHRQRDDELQDFIRSIES